MSDITGAAPRDIILHGVGHIPEDRQKHGLVMEYPLTDNLVLQTYNQPPFAAGIVRNDRAVLKNAEERIAEFDVRTSGSTAITDTLSGGNKQKVIVARSCRAPSSCSSPHSPPAALTSAPSSSSTAA